METVEQNVHIQGFRIKNYKALKNIEMGRLWDSRDKDPLTPLTVLIGRNGTGKSTLLDAFGFLSDCLKHGVEAACDLQMRGGIEKLISQGQDNSIEFEIYYKENRSSRPLTYELAISVDKNDRPYVKRERLRQRRQGQKYGKPFSFLILDNGKGFVWSGDREGIQEKGGSGSPLIEESNDGDVVELDDYRHLGIATLGTLKAHPRISAFRKFMENWYLSYFIPDAARSLPLAGPQKMLNMHGDNIGNVVQFMERDNKDRFQEILKQIAEQIPGIDKIDTDKTPDGRLLLRFNDKGFKDPFYAQQMSDGTLKVFAYMLLMSSPNIAPFICIEEPENGIYHKLLDVLVRNLRNYAGNSKGNSQIFITTHQPYLVDMLDPEEVWILKKGEDGFSTVERASEIRFIKNMVEEGQPLGALWYSDYLD